jgi:hypothetical protein
MNDAQMPVKRGHHLKKLFPSNLTQNPRKAPIIPQKRLFQVTLQEN